jgi:hypothetical protein
MTTILFQAYGLQDIYDETLFSLLSLYQIKPENIQTKICIYTDNEEYFKKALQDIPNHQVQIVQYPLSQFQAWKGDINFVHRVKLEVIKDFFKQTGDSLFYLDSDTVFLKPIQHILNNIAENEQKAYMHICEGKISDKGNPIMKKMNNFLLNNKFEVQAKKIIINPSSYMWNAGVIGINISQKHLIDQMLELTDYMFKIYSKHVIEQFVVSYYLQNNFHLYPTDELIYHYWFYKEFRKEIKQYFDKNGKNLNQLLNRPIPQPWVTEHTIEKFPTIL